MERRGEERRGEERKERILIAEKPNTERTQAFMDFPHAQISRNPMAINKNVREPLEKCLQKEK